MKSVITSIILLCASVQGRSQFVTQSAEGKGSVLLRGSNISFDPGKTDISVTVNNLYRPFTKKPKDENSRMIYGGTLSAKNNEGVGDLFSAGDLTPAAALTGFGGYRWSNAYVESAAQAIGVFTGQLTKLRNANEEKFKKDARSFLKGLIRKTIAPKDPALAKKIESEWLAQLGKDNRDDFEAWIAALTGPEASVIMTRDLALKELKIKNENMTAKEDVISKKISEGGKDYEKIPFWRLSLFGLGGIDAASFKRSDSINKTNLPKSFVKEDFRGAKLGFGVNYQINRFTFGITYVYRITNNLSTLTKSDYKMVTTYSSGNQTLTKETAISAYTGTYATVELMEVNVDALYRLPLGEQAKATAIINPYYRGNLYSRNEKMLPSTYNIGLGVYLFSNKSKFLGGLYVELPDVDSALERNKPVEEQNIRPLTGRLTFGIVGKFNLSSMLSETDK